MIEENKENNHNYPIHPAANLLPLMLDEELQALAADIKRHGQREPIRLLDGQVIDGRHRLEACKIAGVKPVCLELADSSVDDPVEYVLSLNLHRRQLTTGQRAMIAADRQICRLTDEQAAIRFAVCERTIRSARAVLKQGDQQLVEEVRRGTTTLNAASVQAGISIKPSKRATKSIRSKIKRSESVTPKGVPSNVDVERCLESGKVLKDIAKAIRNVIKMVQAVPIGPGTTEFCSRRQSIQMSAEQLLGAVQVTIPHSVCLRCNGSGCPQCGNLGWVNSVLARELST